MILKSLNFALINRYLLSKVVVKKHLLKRCLQIVYNIYNILAMPLNDAHFGGFFFIKYDPIRKNRPQHC